MFTLSGGGLSLKASPDYETKSSYSVTVKATAGTKSATKDVTVTVSNVNEAPTIKGLSAVNFPENSTAAVGSYSASDPEGATTTLTLGGTDAASFTFTGGALSFNSAPDYENKNSYSVTFTASDGTNEATLEVTVTITDVAEAMSLSGSSQVDITENATDLSLGTYTAVDPDGATVTWSLEGADAGMFTLSGGALSLKSSPDYEAKSSYSVTVKATAGTKSATRAVTVSVTNVDEAPRITGGPTAPSYAENGTGVVATYTASDPENDAIAWSVEGRDAASFGISGAGDLTFNSSPDYETKNSYAITVKATANGKSATRDVTVTITDVDEAVLPGQVTGLVATATDHDTVALRWNVPSDGAPVTGYRILRRAVDSENRFEALGQNTGSASTTWTDEDGLSARTKYAYRVQALGEYGAGELSAPATVITPLALVPGQVTGLRATATAHNRVSLTWNAPSDGTTVTGYRILRRAVDSENSFQVLSQNTATTTWTDDGLSARTKYTYRVQALGEYGAGELSTPAEVITPLAATPGKVTGLVATTTVQDTVSLTWDAPSGGAPVTGYRILRRNMDTENSLWALVQNTGNTNTTWTDVNVSAGTNYAYRVQALGNHGAGELSTPATVIAPVPGQVTGLTATATAHDTVSLSWNAPSGGAPVTGYRILRRLVERENDFQALSQDTGSTSTAWTDDSNVNARTRYAYRVQALSGHRLGELSDTAVATTPRKPLPGQVTGLTVTATAHDTVSLTWNAPSDGAPVTGYRILRRAVDSENRFQPLVQSAGSASTAWTDDGLSARTKYAYRVQALGEYGAGELSTPAEVIMPHVPLPGQVTGLTATATAHDSVSLSWNAPNRGAPVTGYRILRRAVDSEDDFQALSRNTATATTTWTDDGLSARTKYAYRVQALGEYGAGELSTPAEVIMPHVPLPGQVTGLTATATAHDTVSLSWEAPSDGAVVTGYRILRRAVDSEDDFQALSQNTATTTTAWTDDDGLSARTKYAYRVQALGEYGAGELSTPAEVIMPHVPLPGRVTVLTATATAHDTVSLSWEAPSDGAAVTGYRILRRAVDSETEFQVLSQNTGSVTTTWTDDSVSSGTKYAYRVQALGEHGEGDLSTLAEVLTP